MYERPHGTVEQDLDLESRFWTNWPDQIAAAGAPTTLAAVVDGADLGGRGGALAGVLGQQLLHPRQMGA